jgi:hypothetical protein
LAIGLRESGAERQQEHVWSGYRVRIHQILGRSYEQEIGHRHLAAYVAAATPECAMAIP